MFLSNQTQCFQQTSAIETSISDFHKMVVTVVKTCYKTQQPKTIQYRNYKYFYEQSFKFAPSIELLKIDTTNSELKEFNELLLEILLNML